MKWLKKVAATPLTSIARVVDSLADTTNDRTNAPSIHAVREAVNENWLNIYPIGSIYMSVNNVDPSLVFGGTWEQIKDRFLLACGDTYTNGEKGGAATHTPTGTVGNHTLTINEMPAHDHTLSAYAMVSSGEKIITNYQTSAAASGSGAGGIQVNDYTDKIGVVGTATSKGGGAAHNHTFTGNSQNTLPPYLAVNVWVRTA